MPSVPTTRQGLYGVLGLFSFVVFVLSIARVSDMAAKDASNGGVFFYDPAIIWLLITSILSLLWCGVLLYVIHMRTSTPLVSTFRGEIGGLTLLWLFWIIGAGLVATNLTACTRSSGTSADADTDEPVSDSGSKYHPCGPLRLITAMAWLTFFLVWALLGFTIGFLVAVARGQWSTPFGGSKFSEYSYASTGTGWGDAEKAQPRPVVTGSTEWERIKNAAVLNSNVGHGVP
ncbi:hypothetical protein MKEN_00957900 [Mycena kentingensis (nom. inval.)]|nr:hypothetical protein MKEN_00957900 [Mycena kentingensis (nom. inval.)]